MLKNIITQLKMENKSAQLIKLTCMYNLKENKTVCKIIK